MRQYKFAAASAAILGLAVFLALNVHAPTAGAQPQPQPQPQAQAEPSAVPTFEPTPNPNRPPSAKGSMPFSPITIADFGPVSTNAFFPAGVWISGDWVVYGAQSVSCGHCGGYTHHIYAQNVIDNRLITIEGAKETIGGNPRSMGRIQVNGSLITWFQVTRRAEGQESFTPGTYDCGQCYYDLAREQGGAWSGGTLPANPPTDWEASISEVSTKLIVRQKSTGKVVIEATPGGRWTMGGVVLGTDKLVFYQTQVGHGVPQYLKLVWLMPPQPEFDTVWAKADQQVAERKATRSWLWGPAPLMTAREEYREGKNGERVVQYYDKSRMEINHPEADPNSPGYVTNGLLAVEMIGGTIQVGDNEMVQASVPCTITVAGDPRKDNPLTPDYSTLANVASLRGENQASSRIGQRVDDAIDVHGVLSKDQAHANLARYATFVPQTGHNIPDVFNKYLTNMQATYGLDWTFVLGYPITEAYWTQMRVSGKDMPVLIQAYQRRVLTYVPDFEPTWQVQQGNVGQHYLEWRAMNRVHKLPRPDLGQ